MFGSLIEQHTSYDYDYKFYAMQRGINLPRHEVVFVYAVFAIDFFIFFASIVVGLFFGLLGIAWLCGAQL